VCRGAPERKGSKMSDDTTCANTSKASADVATWRWDVNLSSPYPLSDSHLWPQSVQVALRRRLMTYTVPSGRLDAVREVMYRYRERVRAALDNNRARPPFSRNSSRSSLNWAA
jgi:hypothetical protein